MSQTRKPLAETARRSAFVTAAACGGYIAGFIFGVLLTLFFKEVLGFTSIGAAVLIIGVQPIVAAISAGKEAGRYFDRPIEVDKGKA